MSRRKQPIRWSNTEDGIAAYHVARAKAQARANELGMDHSLEANDLFMEWTFRALPMRKNRFGHELQCEVVMPESLEKCLPGHGPRSA